MISVTLSQFRSQQSELIGAAQREPVELTSRGASRRAVVVSPEFYDAAIEALEDRADVRAAATARREERVSHEDLMAELFRVRRVPSGSRAVTASAASGSATTGSSTTSNTTS